MLLRALQRLERLLNGGAMILLTIMMVLGFVDVAGRYLFDSPVLGTREISAGYLMVGVVWLSIAHTERISGHIGVDIAVRRASEKTRGWRDVLGRLISIVPLALIAMLTYQEMVDSLGDKTRGAIELYVAPSWALVFLGAAVLVVTLCSRIAIDIARLLKDGKLWS